MSTNDTLLVNPQYFLPRQTFGMPNYMQANPNMFDYGVSNLGGSYYDKRLEHDQSSFSGMPLLQMYQSGVLDKQSLILMSMMGGNTSNTLQLMTTIRNMESQNYYKQQSIERNSNHRPVHFASELEEALGNIEVFEPDGTRVVIDEPRKKRFIKDKTEEETPSVASEKEKVEKSESISEEEMTFGGVATGAAVGHAVAKNLAKKKGYLNAQELLKYEQKYELGSDAIKSTKGVKALESFNGFEINGNKADASDWLKLAETKNTHFTELNGGKGYSLDELRTLKNPPEKVTKFLNQVDDAAKIRLDKREHYSPKDEMNLKALENRNAAYSKLESAQSHISDLKAQIKTAKGADKLKLKEDLKLAKEELGKTNKEFEKVSKEFEKVAKEQSELNVKTAKTLETQTSDLLKKMNKAKTEAGMKDVLNKTLEKAKLTKNKDMVKVCEELLVKDSKTMLSSCEGIAQNAKGFAGEAQVAAKNLNKLTKAKGILGKAALPVAIAFEGFDIYKAYGKSTKAGNKQVVKSAAGLGGAVLAGALSAGAIGAAVGTVVPVAGNIVGGAVGLILGCAIGAVGYWLGSKGGEAIADEAFGEDEPETAEQK